MAKSAKTRPSKERRVKTAATDAATATDGLIKLAIVVAIFSIILFGALSLASSGSATTSSSRNTDKTSPNRVIPKYANPEGKPMEAEEGCEDRNSQCPVYARNGECDKAIGWMVVNCPVSCGTCHLRDAKVRCDRETLNITHTKALEPNTLHNIFDRLENKLASKYKVNVHSRSPFVVTIDDFMTSEEADALITAGGVKWERSTDTGTSNKFGETGRVLTEKRTSSNSWCREDCLANPHVQNIVSKIKDVTMIDDVNYESFQVLRYENGQFYNAHHDTGQSQFGLSCGQRILTFFLYLSDVEEGGQTAFPLLNISVTPKKGKALIWPGVHNNNPNAIDDRTLHEAQPVMRGLKYAANTWIHQYDFKTSNTWGCTGTFE